MQNSIFFQKITYEVLSKRVEDFLLLEKLTTLNPHWEEDNYLVDLPKKYDFSIMMIKDNQLLGFIICSKKNESIHINRFIINTNNLGQGFGTILLNEFINRVKESFLFVSLKVLKDSKAVDFYKKNAFNIIKEEENYYLMERKI